MVVNAESVSHIVFYFTEQFREKRFRSLEISADDVMVAPKVEATEATQSEETYKILPLSSTFSYIIATDKGQSCTCRNIF